ncbi:MAG: phosphoribosylanthranilate isomerase [Alphaproteobacteria bacterium]|nr:phosphoribosylanthranilate isomerase [Alphaproteobacteria bacterium]
MAIAVKICGVNEPEAIAASASADFAGFNFFPRSPRYIDPARASELAASLAAAVKRVAVVVDLDDERLAAIMRALAPDFVQLHGKETPARAAEIRARFKVGIIKALSIAEPSDLDNTAAFEPVADWLLFDAKPPKRPGALPGGNATRFDWTLLRGRRFARPWLLSGGLDPANVAEAIKVSGASAVDVSSGVESAPGRKDPARIAAFLRAARG